MPPGTRARAPAIPVRGPDTLAAVRDAPAVGIPAEDTPAADIRAAPGAPAGGSESRESAGAGSPGWAAARAGAGMAADRPAPGRRPLMRAWCVGRARAQCWRR